MTRSDGDSLRTLFPFSSFAAAAAAAIGAAVSLQLAVCLLLPVAAI